MTGYATQKKNKLSQAHIEIIRTILKVIIILLLLLLAGLIFFPDIFVRREQRPPTVSTEYE